ncbi:MAG: hypothetical protein UR66_C0003G0123 [Candidatus Moranbacteria bacterium GW2011_GWE1_35_17]|nr:MAG: hypothetical protein UR66_C0003G0123 [Candidatus Moranbacteria bacterium GW2011_GWE1_35_17]KKP71503.1 MAG: hypothetical protein UR65_C0034G0004 [Candidatus Moranbacteria bacterium GW2011_GWE2_35_164]KKP84569.1 MAG: hypothetical protein UR83_C0018G0016 [Candidatus Moranbacteria bacterium GW2011_GWF2_35_54]KKP84601.1 MAG: hypothetical protein UR82_C0002G0018 [Candidatus Moranbacteria bacterium GW2011_GWF1_35_5]
MHIILEIKEDKVSLLLKDKKKIVDEISWKERLDLSEKLLFVIDKLLVKNNLKSSDMSKMIVKYDISDNLTTVRISEMVAKTFNFSKIVD